MPRFGLRLVLASVLLAASGRGSMVIAASNGASAPRIGVPGVSDTIVTPQMIALGDSIFHGRVAGGLCFSCHAPDAKGIRGLAPNLTDASWLHGDGSYAFIVATVEKGVPRPKEAFAPMLPKGGARLSVDQVRAVAGYVYSLSRR